MARNRTYSWLGGAQNIEPETAGSTTVSEIIQMIPAQLTTESAGDRTQTLIEAIYLKFSVKRLLITELDAAGFIVYQGQVATGSNNPAQVVDALSLSSRVYQNKNIMMMAPLPVPKIGLSGDLLSATITGEIQTGEFEYQAMRKHDLSNQVLCLVVNTDVSVVLNVFCQWRVLVSWGR